MHSFDFSFSLADEPSLVFVFGSKDSFYVLVIGHNCYCIVLHALVMIYSIEADTSGVLMKFLLARNLLMNDSSHSNDSI